jgi:PAS domain S-box-containing protein
VLIVDDNPAKRLSLRAALMPLGYAIVEASPGLDALRCVTAQGFAVILLDVRMPNMDGFETAAHIRKRRQSEMTPIIFITAHAKNEVLNSDLYVEGAVDVIFPPVPPIELRAKVSVFANLFIRAEELAQRAREVQESVDQLRLLFDAAPIGIFQTDSQNKYVYTNPRWTEIGGCSADEAAGKRWDTILGEGARTRLVAELPDGELEWLELRQRFEIHPPGSVPRIVLMTSQSIPDNHRSAARVLDETATYLGAGIADLINLFNPERIVVGGWLGQILEDRLLPAVRDVAAQHALRKPYRDVSIVPAELGRDAVALGAATLPVNKFLATGHLPAPRKPVGLPSWPCRFDPGHPLHADFP